MSPDDRILTEANKNQLRKFFERHVEFFKTEKNVNKKACKNIKIKEIHKGKSAIAVIAESKQTVKISLKNDGHGNWVVACVIFGRFIQKNVNDFLIEFTNGIGQRCRRGKFIPFHQKMNYLCFFYVSTFLFF